MVTPVPDRARECLRIIASHIDRDGYPPTIREIAIGMGISAARANNSVSEHIDRLERRGLVRRVPKIARGLLVTAEGRAELARESVDAIVPKPIEPPPHGDAA